MKPQPQINLDFVYWIDKAPITGILPFPIPRARREIWADARRRGGEPGRITIWLWREGGFHVAFAMARLNGRGAGDRPAIVEGAPPFEDADKAQMVCERERVR